MLFLFFLILVVLGQTPIIDDSWNITNCAGCSCLTLEDLDCSCGKDCPNIPYFYIINLDPFDYLEGMISHSISINQTYLVIITCYYPIFERPSWFYFCSRGENLYCMESVYHHGQQTLEKVITPNITEIFFWFRIYPKAFSIWEITNISWVVLE